MQKKIGEFLAEKGLIHFNQIPLILEHSKRTGLRFGESAIDLGFLKPEKLIQVFGANNKVDFFYIKSEYFPKATQSLFTQDEMILYGVLPLGIKIQKNFFKTKKILNLGFLNPGDVQKLEKVKKIIHSRNPEFNEFRDFLIISDHFLEIIEKIYSVSASELFKKKKNEIDSVLHMKLS